MVDDPVSFEAVSRRPRLCWRSSDLSRSLPHFLLALFNVSHVSNISHRREALADADAANLGHLRHDFLLIAAAQVLLVLNIVGKGFNFAGAITNLGFFLLLLSLLLQILFHMSRENWVWVWSWFWFRGFRENFFDGFFLINRRWWWWSSTPVAKTLLEL